MAGDSDPFFRTFHALRIKGFAKSDTVAEVADLPLDVVEQHLVALQDREWAQLREARMLWQLTPLGREEHRRALDADLAMMGSGVTDDLSPLYEQFLAINEQFKCLCGDWQLRDGAPNDHTDAAYDAAVIERLRSLDAQARPAVQAMGVVVGRLASYAPRLEAACHRVLDGERNMFTGVMCGSYHDVWMELHEDLILTQGIDRVSEGSF
jgi:hypothetical protein